MYDMTPMANALLRKFSTAAPGWFSTAEGLALVRKATDMVAAMDWAEAAEKFKDQLAVIQVTA
jgi:hypothetical protein